MAGRLAAVATALLALAVGSAGASHPGGNGLIVYSARKLNSDRCCFLTTIRPDGTGRRVFGFGAGAWSPDGTRLAASSVDGLVVMSPDGSGSRKLGVDGGAPSWSADGRWIAYQGGGNSDLFVVSASGGEPRQITSGPNPDSNPDWSPDGALIAYEYEDGIWTVTPDGTGARRLATGESPSWSPDGKRLAFDRDESIYVVARDGSGEQRLRQGQEPAWSPDGRRLAFAWRGSLCVSAADGSDARLVDAGVTWVGSGGVNADWQPQSGASLPLSASSCEHPVARLVTTVGTVRATVRRGGLATFVVSVRNRGPDTGFGAFPYDVTGAGSLLSSRATLGACGAGASTHVDAFDGVYIRPGDCLSIRLSARASEPGRIHLVSWRNGGLRLVASVVVAGCTILGTPGDDRLVGTPGPDVICADLGDDTVLSRGGDDVVYGGEGNDRIVGGPGRDRLVGGRGRAVLLGGPGNDTLEGQGDRDRLYGGAGDDVLRGEALGPRELSDEGVDRDLLDGGPGRDLLDGGGEHDVVRAGAGNDVVLARDHIGDTINCAAGQDRAYIDAVTGGRPDAVRSCEFVQRG